MQDNSISKHSYRTSYPLIVLAAMFLIGMIYGVLLLSFDSKAMSGTISLITGEYTSKLKGQGVFESFVSAFWSAFIFVLIPYLLGYSAIFQPIILLVAWFKGLGLGFFMANLYLSYGFSGVGFCALVIMPATIIGLFCMIVSSREALKLSNMFFFSFAGKSREAVTLKAIKLYNVKFLVLTGICLGAAGLNVVCVLLFSGLFSFT